MNLSSLEFEIIELGAVKVNEKGEALAEFHSYVSPRVYHKMHYKSREVTGITIRDLVKRGHPFYQVAREFFTWAGKDAVFITWGDMDLTELQKNCEYFGYPKIFPKPFLYIDMQKLYCLQYGDGKKRVNLKQAVEELGIEATEEFHSAIADARYTARVMQHIDMEKFGGYYSVDYHLLPQNTEEEYRFTFQTYSKYVSREFRSREEALRDKTVLQTYCFLCGEPRPKKLNWFSLNGHSYRAVANCPYHGLTKSKIKIKKGRRGGVFVVKTEKLTTTDHYLELKKKRQEAEKKRQKKLQKLRNS